MRASIVWASPAQRDFLGILAYLKLRSAQAAVNFNDAVSRQLHRLERFPESGRRVPEDHDSNPPLRELIITDYRLVYSFRGRRIEIIALFHGRRPLARGLLH